MKTIEQLKAERPGLRLVCAGVPQTAHVSGLREGSTGRVVAVPPPGRATLSRVWAVAEADGEAYAEQRPDAAQQQEQPKPEMAFYRKYTEAMLRRYLRLSMQAGRVPSLLGRELFRGHVTSYRVHSFEDVVIFCFDMEKRLARLEPLEKQMVKRVALQQYTQGEAAAMLGVPLRTSIRVYGEALDHLTKMLLKAGMLEPLKSCQDVETVENATKY
jgi:hypothetical protein